VRQLAVCSVSTQLLHCYAWPAWLEPVSPISRQQNRLTDQVTKQYFGEAMPHSLILHVVLCNCPRCPKALLKAVKSMGQSTGLRNADI
jgi:hypothetical protein